MLLASALRRAQKRLCLTGAPCREFLESEYSTLNGWSRARRMLCKAEALAGMKSSPHFVTTNIRAKGIFNAKGNLLMRGEAQSLDEEEHCSRGNAASLPRRTQKANSCSIWEFHDHPPNRETREVRDASSVSQTDGLALTLSARLYTRTSWITLPSTLVNLRCTPLCSKVSFSWFSPRRWRIVALKS